MEKQASSAKPGSLPPIEFAEDAQKFLSRCTKPDKSEYFKIVRAVGAGFLMMGAIGYAVKLVHIPIRHLITQVSRRFALYYKMSKEPTPEPIETSPEESAPVEDKEPQKNAAADFIAELTGKEVIVKLTSTIEYHGLLQAVDGFMNITLQNTKEVYDGKLVAEYGDVFLRGSMVAYIAAA